MDTAVHLPHHNLIRKWHKKTLSGLPRTAANGAAFTSRVFSTDTKNTGKADNAPPPLFEVSEEQPLCIDPISALNIPNAQYRNIRALTLCRKGMTEIHPNIQYLENLDTLIIRHNRLSRIANLLPPRRTTQDGGIPVSSVRGCQLLRRLYASHNCLQTLDGDVCGLRHLEALFLANNQIANLHTVAAQLRPLSWLRELDLRDNPLCDAMDYRLYLIHALPQVEVLDRRQVQPKEREEAAARFAAPTRHTVSGETSPSALSTPRSKVAFMTNFSPPAKPHCRARLFAPSACVRQLDARVRRDAARATAPAADPRGAAGLRDALHATFALSRRGLPLSAERWEPVARRLARGPETPELSAAPPAREQRRERAAAAREQPRGGEAPERFPVPAVDLPALAARLPPPLPAERGARSVLYDALGAPAEVPARIGSNVQCVPEPGRIGRIRETLGHASALLTHLRRGAGETETRETAELLRAVQDSKDALVPEPWEHAKRAAIGAGASQNERVEYAHLAVVQLLLPAELRALEGQFLHGAPSIGDPSPQQQQQQQSQQQQQYQQQQQQQQKRSGRKDRRGVSQGESSTTAPVSTVQPFTPSSVAGTQLLQQLPHALTSVMEIGPTDRSTIVRVMNMLDGESGAWALSVDRMTEAIRAEFVGAGGDFASLSPQPYNGIAPSSSFTTKQQQQQSTRKGKRHKGAGERRGVSGSMGTGQQSHSNASPTGTGGAAARAPPIALSAVLLSLVRYIPFAESRRDFFRAQSVATGVKGESGAVGESAREWFARAQWAAAHCERLREGMREAGMTEEDVLTKLVPMHCMLTPSTSDVGSLFANGKRSVNEARL